MSGRFHGPQRDPDRLELKPRFCHDCGRPATYIVDTRVLQMDPYGQGTNQRKDSRSVGGAQDYACADCARRVLVIVGGKPWRIPSEPSSTPSSTSSAPSRSFVVRSDASSPDSGTPTSRPYREIADRLRAIRASMEQLD